MNKASTICSKAPSFLKKSGVVTFEILPVIEAGLPAEEMAKRLETEIETASARLLKEAQEKY